MNWCEDQCEGKRQLEGMMVKVKVGRAYSGGKRHGKRGESGPQR